MMPWSAKGVSTHTVRVRDAEVMLSAPLRTIEASSGSSSREAPRSMAARRMVLLF